MKQSTLSHKKDCSFCFGSLHVNCIQHFFFAMFDSKQIVSEVLVSQFWRRFTIRFSFTKSSYHPLLSFPPPFEFCLCGKADINNFLIETDDLKNSPLMLFHLCVRYQAGYCEFKLNSSFIELFLYVFVIFVTLSSGALLLFLLTIYFVMWTFISLIQNVIFHKVDKIHR